MGSAEEKRDLLAALEVLAFSKAILNFSPGPSAPSLVLVSAWPIALVRALGFLELLGSARASDSR
jgi:hypothetical protein